MGQCGCGDFKPNFKLPGPNGSVYCIELFSGCHDCRAPAGVVIEKLSGEELITWDVQTIPTAQLVNLGKSDDHQTRAWALVDVEALAKYIGFEDDEIELYRGLQATRPKVEW